MAERYFVLAESEYTHILGNKKIDYWLVLPTAEKITNMSASTGNDCKYSFLQAIAGDILTNSLRTPTNNTTTTG